MQILQLAAAFGQQDLPPLDLAPGLNIIKVPSRESAGVWTALLRDMLYGPDPGMAPRSAASRGRLECATAWGTVSVTRWTASAGAPLGAFSAVCAASGQSAYLTPAGCGEALLGISRDIFDREAVLSLPRPGEGEAAMERLRAHQGVLEEDRGELAMLQARAAQLEDLLERHQKADRREAALAAENAQLDFSSARDKVKTMEAAKRSLPTKAELTSLRASLDSLDAQSGPLRMAGQRLDQAEKALRFAESALEAQPRPEPPLEEAEPRPRLPVPLLCGALAAGLALGAAVFYAAKNLPVAIGGGLGLFGLLALLAALLLRRRQKQWDLRRAEVEERRAQAGTACSILQENAEKARTARQEAEDARDAVAAIYRAGLTHVLTGVRSFRPFAKDLDDARQAVADGLLARRELDQALEELEEARRRWEALRKGAVYPLPPPVRRPEEDREALQGELDGVNARLEALRVRFAAALEERAQAVCIHLTREADSYQPSDQDGLLCLAARLAEWSMALPETVPLVLEAALDQLDGGGLSVALDCLVELSQTRQVLLLTDLDREASCLRRTHPDRFRLVRQ